MPKLSITEKKAALQAQIDELEAIEKKQQATKQAVIGRVVLEAMTQDNELKHRIDTLISQHVTKNKEREMFGLEKITSNRGRKATATI